MTSRPVLYLLVLALLASGPVLAQQRAAEPAASDEYLVRAWTTADGLPVNFIETLTQTPDGYLWLATSAGLLRFDGLRFRLYGQDVLTGWTTTYVDALFVDRRGRLWLGSVNGEVGRVEHGRFRLLAGRPRVAPDESAGVIKAPLGFVEDEAGAVWIARWAGGVLRVGPDNRATVFTAADGHPGPVRGLLRDDDRRLWAVMAGGPAWFNGTRFVPHGSSFPAGTVVPGRDGSLWMEAGDHSLVHLKGGRTEFYDRQNGLPTGDWELLREAVDGAFWFRTERGIERWDGRGTTVLAPAEDLPILDKAPINVSPEAVFWASATEPGVVRVHTDDGMLHLPVGTDFNVEDVTDYLVDAEGSVWLSTNAGLFRFTRRRVQALTESDGLREGFLFPILAGRDGGLWLGSWGGGLHRFNDGRLTALTTADGLPSSSVRALMEDRQGRLWVGALRGAAVVRDGRVVSTFTPPSDSDQTWYDFLESRDGAVYGTSDALYRIREVAPDRFIAEPEFSGLTGARTVIEDRQRRLWVGARNGLFVREDGPGGTWRPFAPLTGRFVVSLFEDDRGTLWAGTQGAGLWRIAPDGAAFVYTRARHGLHHDGIWWIEPDEQGGQDYFWMTSDAGIGRYRRQALDDVADGRRARLDPLVLTTADGMPSSECDSGQPGGARGPDGRLWFPTIAGAAIIDPARIAVNDRPPPVRVEEVTADGVPLEGWPEGLPAGTENIAFRYTALSLVNAEANRFRYRLEGVDEGWVEAGTRRETFYSNLGPGRYTFRMQGSNNDGVWSTTDAAYAFAIAPFWWQRAWFQVLLVLIALSLVIGAWRYRERYLQTVTLEARVRERTAALHAANEKMAVQAELLTEQSERLQALDRAKRRFFANVSHEFRTPLTLILGPLRDLLNGQGDALDEAARNRLAVAERNAVRLKELTDQLFALTRIEAGVLRVHPQPGDLAEAVRAVVQEYVPLAERKGVRLEGRTDGGVCPACFDPEALRTILGNLFANAVRFTPKGGGILVTLDADSTHASVRVRDDGIGITPEKLPRVLERFAQADDAPNRAHEGLGLGLSLAQELAALHGGRIEAESAEGSGSTFTLVLPSPDPLPRADRPAGSTRARLSPLTRGTASGALSAAMAPEAGGSVATTPEPGGLGGSDGPAPDLLTLKAMEPTVSGDRAASDDAARPLVLVADDNADVRALLRGYLSPAYRVAEAADGAEALKRARAERPALVLADVMMPGTDGLALLAALRADDALSDVPVILLTARAGPEYTAEGFDAGATDYIEKPFDKVALLALVARRITERHHFQTRYARRLTLAPDAPPLETADEELLDRVQAALAEHLHLTGFNAEALAQAASISKSQLNRRLKALGLPSAVVLLRGARLDHAAKLLETRAVLVKEAATRVGIRDVDYFTRRFKERFGVLPSEYPSDDTSAPVRQGISTE